MLMLAASVPCGKTFLWSGDSDIRPKALGLMAFPTFEVKEKAKLTMIPLPPVLWKGFMVEVMDAVHL